MGNIENSELAGAGYVGMTDRKGNVVVAAFEDGTWDVAVLLRRSSSRVEYVVAYGYVFEDAEWSHGTYTTDLAYALDLADPDVIFGATVRWRRRDIALALSAQGLPADAAHVEEVADEIGFMKPWSERAIGEGNDCISEAVRELAGRPSA